MINEISVGIILPVYNAVNTIDRAINSVLSQSHKNFILYIIEDCSTDGTRQKLQSYENTSNVVITYNNENLGVAKSRNRGLDLNQQQVVTYIDSDDEWLPEKLVKQLECYVSNNEMPCVTAYNFLSNDSKQVRYHTHYLSKNNFLKKNYRICLSSLMHKHNDLEFENVGHEDFLFIYQLYRVSDEIVIIDEPLVNYYVMNGSLSSNKFRAAIWHYNLLLNKFKLSRFKTIYYLFFYVKNAILFRYK